MVKVIRASALILLLACSAQAGWMANGSPEPPPPSQPTSAAVTGYMPNGSPEPPQPTDVVVQGPAENGIIQNGVTVSLTQIALELLTALPSLL